MVSMNYEKLLSLRCLSKELMLYTMCISDHLSLQRNSKSSIPFLAHQSGHNPQRQPGLCLRNAFVFAVLGAIYGLQVKEPQLSQGML